MAHITWERLVALEPRLEAVRAYAVELDRDADGGFCASAAWTEVGVHLAYVVGPDRPQRRDPTLLGQVVAQRWHELRGGVAPADVFGPVDMVLRSPAAFDIAAATVRAALPACRNCDCNRPKPG